MRSSHFVGKGDNGDVVMSPCRQAGQPLTESEGLHSMRFMPVKNDSHMDLRALLRGRDRSVARRAAVMNQMHGILLNLGTVSLRNSLTRQVHTPLEQEAWKWVH